MKYKMIPEELLNIIYDTARQRLTRLTIKNRDLKTLPPEIGLLQNLVELDLASNQLTTLPAEIGQLKKLGTLILSDNQITALPSEIGHLENLNYLKLRANKLTNLPVEIAQLQNLKILNLTKNKLISLPSELSLLSNLNCVYLSGNQLPEGFQHGMESAQTTQTVKKLLKKQKILEDQFYQHYDIVAPMQLQGARKEQIKLVRKNISNWAKKFRIFIFFKHKNSGHQHDFIKLVEKHILAKNKSILTVSMAKLSSTVFCYMPRDKNNEPREISAEEYIVALEEEAKRLIADQYQNQLAKVFEANQGK